MLASPPPQTNPSGTPATTVRPPLEPHQVRLVRLLAGGMSNKDIGHALRIPENTVKSRLDRIYRTWGVRTRSELMSAGVAEGVLACRSCHRRAERQALLVTTLTKTAQALRGIAQSLDAAVAQIAKGGTNHV